MSSIRHYLMNESGGGAAEFALVLPILLLFGFGLIEFGMLMYTTTQLHWATEDAARCASVRQDCRVNGTWNNVATRTYAAVHYKGFAPATFSTTNSGACAKDATNSAINTGYTVAANATFKLNLGVYYKNLNLVSNACFP